MTPTLVDFLSSSQAEITITSPELGLNAPYKVRTPEIPSSSPAYCPQTDKTYHFHFNSSRLTDGRFQMIA